MARHQQLVEKLLSSSVRLQAPQDAKPEAAKLTPQEVAAVFTRHVPGVQRFLFRGQAGQYSLKFLQVAYRDGLRAFQGTALHNHLLQLFRLIVHYGYEDKDGSARYLRELAEAFMECQAVQARVIERVGHQLSGVSHDFRGLVISLLDDCKTWSLRMLAAERLAQGRAQDDENPTHYENRLTADLGELLGLSVADVRRAKLDEHARSRFSVLGTRESAAAARRCRELFDVEALLGAFVAEVNSFSENSPPESMPRLFLSWVADNLEQKHVVFDESCTCVQIDRAFALSVFEVLFLGRTAAPDSETFRCIPIARLFASPTELGTADMTVADLDPQGKDVKTLDLVREDQTLGKLNELLKGLVAICSFTSGLLCFQNLQP